MKIYKWKCSRKLKSVYFPTLSRLSFCPLWRICALTYSFIHIKSSWQIKWSHLAIYNAVHNSIGFLNNKQWTAIFLTQFPWANNYVPAIVSSQCHGRTINDDSFILVISIGNEIFRFDTVIFWNRKMDNPAFKNFNEFYINVLLNIIHFIYTSR